MLSGYDCVSICLFHSADCFSADLVLVHVIHSASRLWQIERAARSRRRSEGGSSFASIYILNHYCRYSVHCCDCCLFPPQAVSRANGVRHAAGASNPPFLFPVKVALRPLCAAGGGSCSCQGLRLRRRPPGHCHCVAIRVRSRMRTDSAVSAL